MAKWEEYLEEGHFEKILTVGGILAGALAASYIIKGYLDILRIKALKKMLKEDKSSHPNLETSGDENWIMEDAD